MPATSKVKFKGIMYKYQTLHKASYTTPATLDKNSTVNKFLCYMSPNSELKIVYFRLTLQPQVVRGLWGVTVRFIPVCVRFIPRNVYAFYILESVN